MTKGHLAQAMSGLWLSKSHRLLKRARQEEWQRGSLPPTQEAYHLQLPLSEESSTWSPLSSWSQPDPTLHICTFISKQ